MTINDVHVHMGYWRALIRKRTVNYYSPARILDHLNRAGVNRFCVSSTSVFEKKLEFVQNEHREMERIASGRCQHLLWIKDIWFDADPNLEQVAADIPYAGLKLHNEESEWIARPKKLNRILAIAKERQWVVQFHTGDGKSDAALYFPFCKAFPEVHFNLSHSRPVKAAISVAQKCPNVFLDCSFSSEESIEAIVDADLTKRLMFGTDFPITIDFGIENLQSYVHERVKLIHLLAGERAQDILSENFFSFFNLSKLCISDSSKSLAD